MRALSKVKAGQPGENGSDNHCDDNRRVNVAVQNVRYETERATGNGTKNVNECHWLSAPFKLTRRHVASLVDLDFQHGYAGVFPADNCRRLRRAFSVDNMRRLVAVRLQEMYAKFCHLFSVSPFASVNSNYMVRL